MDRTAPTPVTAIPLRERLLGWKEILETANPPATRLPKAADSVGRRAVCLPLIAEAHSPRDGSAASREIACC